MEFFKKRLSSYNIKWIIIYILYVLLLIVSEEFEYSSQGYIVFLLFLLPFISYLVFPSIIKIIGKWRIIKWADRIIDDCYNNIKERC